MPSRALRLAAISIIAILVFGIGVAVGGAAVEDKVRAGETVVVGADEVVAHDLYATAETLVVDGTIEGDLVAFGSTVTVNGTVEGDLVVGAARVFINGEVAGDARVGAVWLTVSGSVDEDLLAGAGQIDLTAGSLVGEDLIFGAGDVVVGGTVEGNVLGSASTYDSPGTVGGSETVTITAGGFPTPEPGQPDPAEPERIAGDAVRHLIAVGLFAGLWIWLLPESLRASEGGLRRRPAASAGMGLGIVVGYIIQLIAVTLLMVLLAIAFASITLDALAGLTIWAGLVELFVSTLAFVVGAAFLADAVVGLALGSLVARGWARNRWQELAVLIGGAIVVVAATSLPGIGGLVKLVVVVLGLGGMTVAASEMWQRRNPPAIPAFGTSPPTPPTEPPTTEPPTPPTESPTPPTPPTEPPPPPPPAATEPPPSAPAAG